MIPRYPLDTIKAAYQPESLRKVATFFWNLPEGPFRPGRLRRYCESLKQEFPAVGFSLEERPPWLLYAVCECGAVEFRGRRVSEPDPSRCWCCCEHRYGLRKVFSLTL